jgi:hypothetical protein
MPPQQGVWRRDRGDLPQDRTADPVRSRGQPRAIVVRETQPTSIQLPPQDPILLDHVRDGVPLAPVQPAGQHTEDQLQGREVDHELELISRLPEGCRPNCGTLRAPPPLARAPMSP